MAKKALPLLTGGLNELTRADLLDDTQLQVSDNYEVIGDGTLKLRKEAETFSASLNTELSSLFDEVIFISEPFYPQKMIDTHENYVPLDEYVLFFFGTNPDTVSNRTHLLHLLFRYKDFSGTEQWTQFITWNENGSGADTLDSLLTDDEIIFNSDSDLKFTYGQDRVVVTDAVNNAFFINIDTDGIVRGGKLGIPAPTNKARVTEMTDWQPELWETDKTASRLSDPGLFQCTYSVVTKYGEESNPAPLSETLDMQFFSLDADSIDERWIEKIEIKDLSLPDVPDNILDTLKYFKVYMRVMRYAEGEDIKVLEFTEQFTIANKKDSNGDSLTTGTTGNNYTLTITPSPGDVASYENDIAPIVKVSAEVSGITMLGNVKTKISFPYDFKYYHKITINNRDSKGYVDAVVKIRLWDKDADNIPEGEGSKIDNFDVGDFIDNSGVLSNREHIRLFDTDLTTPIACAFNGAEYDQTLSYMDLYIKIPLLLPASIHNLYLCWNGSADSNTGVPTEYRSFDYGKIFEIGVDTFVEQKVWNALRVSNNDLVVDNFEGIYADISNKADTSIPVISSGIDIETNTFHIPILNNSSTNIGKYMAETEGASSYINYDFSIDATTGISMPVKGTVFFRCRFDAVISLTNPHGLIQIRNSNDEYLWFGIELTLIDQIDYWVITISWDDSPQRYLTEIRIPFGLMNTPEFTMGFSWEYNVGETSKLGIHILYKRPNEVYHLETSLDTGGVDSYIEDIITISNGIRAVMVKKTENSNSDFYINDLRFISGFYLDSTNTDHNDKFQNMANYMPGFDNIIGYKYSDTSNNNNISFDETKEIETKERKNMVKWSDINAINFPDLNFKKLREPVLAIIPAPSFLQFDYKNTFLIFTRNTINRFILEGSADGWAGSTSSLIEEKTQYGLLSKKSLVRAGDSIFWLSEVGVVMWDSQGMKLISKNIVDIPINAGAIGFYNSLRNQYLIQRLPSTDDEGVDPDLDDDDDDDDDVTVFPGWIWGDTVTIRQSGYWWGTTGGEEGGGGVTFEIVGENANEPYSNYIMMSYFGVPRENLPLSTFFGALQASNPDINFWDYVLLDGVPVRSEAEFDTIVNSNGGQVFYISDPTINLEGYPVFSYDLPDIDLTLNFDAIQLVIDSIECATNFFTFGGGLNESGNVFNDDSSGLWCNTGIVFIGADPAALAGFWFVYESFMFTASVTGVRGISSVRDMGEVYAYHIDRNIWTKFKNMDVRDTAILTGGSILDNVNLLLNSSNEVKKYPGDSSVTDGQMKTKKLYFEKGVLRRVNLEHRSNGNTTAFKTLMEKYDVNGEIISKEHTFNDVKTKKWRGVPLGKNRGRSLEFEITNADNIGSIGYDLRIED